MNNNKYKIGLIREGFSIKTLNKLTNNQLSMLYNKIVEQENRTERVNNLKNAADSAKQSASELASTLSDLDEDKDTDGEMDNIVNILNLLKMVNDRVIDKELINPKLHKILDKVDAEKIDKTLRSLKETEEKIKKLIK